MLMKLSTGRQIPDNQGIIGISDLLAVSEGYDAYLHHCDAIEPDTVYDEETRSDWLDTHLSISEMHELADIMIHRWASYKARASINPSFNIKKLS